MHVEGHPRGPRTLHMSRHTARVVGANLKAEMHCDREVLVVATPVHVKSNAQVMREAERGLGSHQGAVLDEGTRTHNAAHS